MTLTLIRSNFGKYPSPKNITLWLEMFKEAILVRSFLKERLDNTNFTSSCPLGENREENIEHILFHCD